MTSKRVVLFSQPRCRPCHALQAYLADKGVEFENRDVSSDAHAVRELVYKYGSRTTPTLVIDEEVVIGFDQAHRSAALVMRDVRFVAISSLPRPDWHGLSSATLGRAVFTGQLLGGAIRPINPLILSQSRVTISCLILVPLLLLRRGAQGTSNEAAAPGSRRQVSAFSEMAGSNYFYYLSIQRTNVAMAITNT